MCFIDTWAQRVSLSFVHCVTLRNAVELRESSKLTPHTVVVMEGLCGTGNITYQTLINTCTLQAATELYSQMHAVYR